MSFNDSVAKVLKTEGGYVNDPSDHGGETNFGITYTVAKAFGYTGSMRDLPVDVAKQIYKRNYWDALSLDDINTINSAIADELFDSAVNCGTSTAAKWLQQGLNALISMPIDVDGYVGSGTVKALKSLSAKDQDILLKLLNVQQGAHYLSLTQRNPNQKRFVRGWLTRVSLK